MAKNKLTPKQDALERACGLFLVSVTDINNKGNDTDVSPIQQYQKLKKAKREGNGNDDATDYAEVWNAIELLSVDEVIDQVDELQKSFLSFLKKHSK